MYTTGSLLGILSAMLGAGGVLNGAKCGLFTNADLPLGPDTRLADLNVPTFGTYATKAVVWGTAAIGLEGGAVVLAGPLTWTIASEADAFTATGFYLTNGAGDTLIRAEKFPEPIPVPGPNYGATAQPTAKVTQ